MSGSFDSMAAMRAAEREEYGAKTDETGAEGAFARTLPVMNAFRSWLEEEMKRSPSTDVSHASLNLIANMVATMALNLATNTGKPRMAALKEVGAYVLMMASDIMDTGRTVTEKVKR